MGWGIRQADPYPYPMIPIPMTHYGYAIPMQLPTCNLSLFQKCKWRQQHTSCCNPHQQTTWLVCMIVQLTTMSHSSHSVTDRSPIVQQQHSTVQHRHKALTVSCAAAQQHYTTQYSTYMKNSQFIFPSSPFACRHSGSCGKKMIFL